MLLWIGFIFSLSLRANPVKAVSEQVSRQVTQSLPKPIKTDQAGHVLEFSVLSVLLLRANRRFTPRGVLIALAGTLIIALMDETLQELVPGRAFELNDLALDLAAALFGILILLLFNVIASLSRAK